MLYTTGKLINWTLTCSMKWTPEGNQSSNQESADFWIGLVFANGLVSASDPQNGKGHTHCFAKAPPGMRRRNSTANGVWGIWEVGVFHFLVKSCGVTLSTKRKIREKWGCFWWPFLAVRSLNLPTFLWSDAEFLECGTENRQVLNNLKVKGLEGKCF